MIIFKFKYFSSVLPLHQQVKIHQAFINKVNLFVVTWYVIEFLIDSKNYESLFANFKK